jgi:hypothetical protein
MVVEETLEAVGLRGSLEGNDPIALEEERLALLAEELREAIRRKLPTRE